MSTGHLSAKAAPKFRERRFDATLGNGSIAYKATPEECADATKRIVTMFEKVVATELLLMLGLEPANPIATEVVFDCPVCQWNKPRTSTSTLARALTQHKQSAQHRGLS